MENNYQTEVPPATLCYQAVCAPLEEAGRQFSLHVQAVLSPCAESWKLQAGE